MAPRHNRGPAPRYKWWGFGELRTIETAVSTSVSEVMHLVPCAISDDAQGDVTVEAIYCHISVRRANSTVVDGVGYIIANQKCTPADGNPIEVLDTVPTGATAVTALANRDIMMHGLLNVPAMLTNEVPAVVSNRENIVNEVVYKARRKLYRLNHGLYLHITADVSGVLTVFVSARTLLRYS